jgi:hypothetical protein
MWKHFYWIADLAMAITVLGAIVFVLAGEIGGALLSAGLLVVLGVVTGWGGRR